VNITLIVTADVKGELMQAHFSYHAFQRVKGRISMPHYELAKQLDDDLVINIGDEPNTNRVHKLFYSEADYMCFVAVQDCQTGMIITILPIDYHENIAWAVPIEQQQQAKKLILLEAYIPIEPSDTPVKDYANQSEPQVFKVSATVVNEYGEHVRSMTLGSWQSGPYGQSIDALVDDSNFVSNLKQIINDKLACTAQLKEFVQTIIIKLGKKGDSVLYAKSDLMPVGA